MSAMELSSPPSLAEERRVLSRAEAMALGEKLLGLVGGYTPGVLIEHTATSIVKVSNDRVLSSHDGDSVSIKFDSEFGSCLPVSIATNQLNEATLQRVVDQAKAMAPKRTFESAYMDDPSRQSLIPRTFTPVSLWHDSTVSAMGTVRERIVPSLIEQMRASGASGVATVGLSARAALYLWRPGLTAWSEETDSEVSVTARTADGKASGWHGEANRDWSAIQPDAVLRDAVTMLDKTKNMVAIEPGRRTAILGPAAVAQLVAAMSGFFSAETTEVYRATPFTGAGGRKNRLGQQLLDPRITMVSDPADAMGGFPPFFEQGGSGLPGLPLTTTTWFENGVLKNLAYDPRYARERGVPWGEMPFSVRVMASPGTPTRTLDEMIASCELGIYVNRFSHVGVVDGSSGTMTGVTRDGCFLVRDGKIEKPVKNFRFLESPMFAFNQLLAIGTPERAAFGYAPPPMQSWESWPPAGRRSRWPNAPVIVPPMMVRDFNFVAMADAV